MMTELLWTLSRKSDGKPVPPFDCNPGHDDQGMLVYRSEEAALSEASHQFSQYDIPCEPRLLGATVNWIACGERLPDDDTTVLVFSPQWGEPVWIGYHDGDDWRTVDGGSIDVTHWAELPAPPE